VTSVPIQVSNVTKRFGDVQALDGVSLSVEKGEMFGLIGHNGAGKSTLFKLMLGLMPVSGGDIRVHGTLTGGHDFRQVRLNDAHPANVKPSAHGDSVGHYEGDTLVIDTIGVKVGPYTTIDRLGTPYTESLHVVERYRLLDYEAAKAAMDLAEKEWPRVGAGAIDPNYRGKGVQLEFTVEDEGVFTMPWSATVTYLRAARKDWEERICAENVGHDYAFGYFSDDAKLPTDETPDF